MDRCEMNFSNCADCSQASIGLVEVHTVKLVFNLEDLAADLQMSV